MERMTAGEYKKWQEEASGGEGVSAFQESERARKVRAATADIDRMRGAWIDAHDREKRMAQQGHLADDVAAFYARLVQKGIPDVLVNRLTAEFFQLLLMAARPPYGPHPDDVWAPGGPVQTQQTDS